MSDDPSTYLGHALCPWCRAEWALASKVIDEDTGETIIYCSCPNSHMWEAVRLTTESRITYDLKDERFDDEGR